jgi:O-acetylhomoserine/O-acetylserine sulfhydrylase-like pyridoxal-dependent enzyme
MDKKYSRETLCVQAGWTPKKGEPRVLPIYQSTTFVLNVMVVFASSLGDSFP